MTLIQRALLGVRMIDSIPLFSTVLPPYNLILAVALI